MSHGQRDNGGYQVLMTHEIFSDNPEMTAEWKPDALIKPLSLIFNQEMLPVAAARERDCLKTLRNYYFSQFKNYEFILPEWNLSSLICATNLTLNDAEFTSESLC